MTREEAIQCLEDLVLVVASDMETMFELAEKKDWKGLRRLVKQIRERKAKYGI
jgi:hypothetical protein